MRAIRFATVLGLLLAATISAALGDSARTAVTGAAIDAHRVLLDDPFPIRRIRIAETQLDAAVNEHGLGPVVRMPRAEFEAKVRETAEARETPRLVEARYNATLEGGDLAGEAEWTFSNRRNSPATFGLEPLRVAILAATWGDGSAAVLGEFGEDTGLAVQVPPGRSTLKLKWSLVGSGTDADRTFDLRLPACSTATLALDLPPDHTPSNSTGALLTGPFPSTRDPKLGQWRFRLGERTRLELGIRGPSDTSGRTALASALAKYDFADSQLAASFEFELRAAHGSLAEWLFHVPPGLTVTDAIANDRVAWRFDSAARTLRVILSQAANSGKFVIAATGPLPSGSAPLPVVKPQNAVGSAERIELRVPAGLALERLDLGDFRIADSTSTADGLRRVVLAGSLLSTPSATRRAPSVRVGSALAEFASNENLEWRIDSNRAVLTARVEIAVRRGPLFRLAFRLPQGFTLDRISNEPDDAVSYASENGSEIEFARPLGSGQRVVIRFELRGNVLPAGESRVPFPAFAPFGATEREGRIAFAPGPGWSVSAQPVGESGGDSVKGYLYRGLEPGGLVILTPIAPAFTASLEPESGRIRITPIRGQPETIRILVQGPPNNRPWKLIGSSNAISAANATALPVLPAASGTVWTVTLARPATEPVTLETTPGVFHVLGASETRVQNTGETYSSKLDARDWSFESLHHVTIASLHRPQVALGGTIRTRGAGPLAIRLPPEAQVFIATVGSNTVEPGVHASEAGEIRLPIPDSNGSLRFEVRYRLPAPTGIPARLSSPLPGLPGNPTIARFWAIPYGASAIWPPSIQSPTAAPSASREHDLAYFRTDESEIDLMPGAWLDAIGIAAAVLLSIAGWIGCRLANRALGAFLMLALLAIGAAFWLGPDAWQRTALPPLLAAAAGSAAIIFVRGWNGRGATPLVIASLFFGHGMAAIAQDPVERNIVLLFDSPGGEVAVVPQSVLDRLTVKRSKPALMIGAASYAGRIEDGLARFTAKFAVHVLRDGEVILELPLADVRLERAAVDGQAAQPLASKPHAYSLPLAGRGVHEVELRFAVPIAASGAEREVRFGIPAAPDSLVEFTAPPTTRQFQSVSRNGGERTSRDKESNRISAALGAVRTLHLRWREGAAGTAATLSVREGCIWDVSESSLRLTACYRIHVKSGSVPSLRFDVPANLEPTRVAIRSLDSLLVPTAVRDWSVGKEVNGTRPLMISLLAPADGSLLVTLDCEPREIPVRQPVLSFPRPTGMTRESAVFGLRASGAVVESIGRTGLIDFAADALIRDFGSVPDLRLTPASQLTAFSPRAGETAELRPVLRPGGALPTATHDATWSLEPARAIGRGTLTWTGPETTPWIEFQIGGADIKEVRGADVATWSQGDGRVQVWLKKSVKESVLEWTATTAPGATFEPPLPAMVNGRNAGQTIRIRPAAGSAIRIDRDKGWRIVASEGREWVFQSDDPIPPPRVQSFPPGNAAGRGFALLEFKENAIVMRAAAEIAIDPGRPEHLVLQVGGAPGIVAPTLDVPPGTLVRERKEPDGSHAWDLDVPAGAAATLRATVSMSLPAKGTVSMPMIDLRIGNRSMSPEGVLRTYGLIGAPNGTQLIGATPSADSAALRTPWPGEVERLRRVGGTTYVSETGRVSVTFPSLSAPSPPIEVPSARDSAAPTVAAEPLAATAWLPAAGWCAASISVLLLFIRSPRTTWPEQLGLLGAMMGFAVAGQFAWGIAVYALARNAWLFRVVLNARR